MIYYTLHQNDQSRPTWVLCKPVEPEHKRRKKEEIPDVVNALLGPSRGPMLIKEKYLSVCCKTCGNYDARDIFKIGFDDDVSIKIKGDFAHSTDRIFLISDKFLHVLKSINAQGFETKPIGATGWHAFSSTLIVNSDENVTREIGAKCYECGHAKDAAGIHEKISQLDVPKSPNTVFTHKSCIARPFYDCDICLTEDIVKALKAGGIKGGCCHRLQSDEEWKKYDASGTNWRPPKFIVYL